jgi:hypothetical protein
VADPEPTSNQATIRQLSTPGVIEDVTWLDPAEGVVFVADWSTGVDACAPVNRAIPGQCHACATVNVHVDDPADTSPAVAIFHDHHSVVSVSTTFTRWRPAALHPDGSDASALSSAAAWSANTATIRSPAASDAGWFNATDVPDADDCAAATVPNATAT